MRIKFTTKKSKTTVFFMTVIISSCFFASSQNRIGFAYDETGNRIRKEIIIGAHKVESRSSKSNDTFFDAIKDRSVKISHDGFGLIRIYINEFSSDDQGYIEIYSVNGIPTIKEKVISETTEIDIRNTESGIYLLNISINGEITTWKLIKK